VVSPVAVAKRVLTRKRYHFISQPVLTVGAHNRPGELARMTAKLAKAGVNINYIYGSNAPRGKDEMVVLSVSDLTRAGAALR